jgi:hypothetical protein
LRVERGKSRSVAPHPVLHQPFKAIFKLCGIGRPADFSAKSRWLSRNVAHFVLRQRLLC